MPEPPAYATLTVLGGAKKGAQLAIDDAVDDILIGSDPDCRLSLDVPGVSPIHARLWLDTAGATLYDTRSPAGVWVNDDRVTDQHPLKDGDIVWLGEPGGALSVMIQFRSSGVAGTPAPAAQVAEAPEAPPAEWVIEGEAASARADGGLLEMLAGAHGDVASDIEPEPNPAAVFESTPVFEPEPYEPEPVYETAPADQPEPIVVEPVSAPTPVYETVFDEEVIDEEPLRAPAPPAPVTPAPVFAGFIVDETEEAPTPAPAAPAVSEEFFLEEPDEAGAPAFAPPAAAAAAPPEPAFSEPSRAFSEPSVSHDFFTPDLPAAVPPPAPPPPPAPAMEEEFFFEPPPAPRPVLEGDAFFIEEPAASASAAAPVLEDAWTAAAEPLSLPADPPQPAAPPPPPPAPPPAPEPIVLAEPPPAAPAARPARPTGARPAPGAPARGARPAPARSTGGSGGGALRWVAIAAGVLALGGVGAFFALRPSRVPRIASVEPERARAGDRIAVVGENFGSDPQAVAVTFGSGGSAGRVVSATPTRIEVEVPTLAGDARVPVVVQTGGKASAPFEVSVYKAPRIHGISPSVAMPGEEVTLAGSDWGAGATVKFGDLPAAVLDTTPDSLKVRVPDAATTVGMSLPVVVSMGADRSNPAPFVIGRIPFIVSVDPSGVAPGDLITIKGHGFPIQPSLNDLKIGGVGALVLSAIDTELKAIVPWAPTGEAAIELTVPRSENVGQASMTIAPHTDPVAFRFVAGLIRDDPSHEHAVLATGLGPAFVLSASGGKSAAERAQLAQQRLNDAATALKASLTADIEVRDLGGNPTLGLAGVAEPLLEVTAEDAAAYNEDWTALRGKGGPVTRARLALWWGAVARDLVLLTVRGERPQHAAALAPEGRVLQQVGDAAKKSGKFGLPLEVVAKLGAPQREALRVLSLRVPPNVKAPADLAVAPAEAAAAAAAGPLKLEGIWSGSETDGGVVKYITVTFTKTSGTLTYERALTMSVPLESVEGQRQGVRFSLKSASRVAWYVGKWDGTKLRGTIHSDTAGGPQAGTFELERKR
jgi:hypothetical protein